MEHLETKATPAKVAEALSLCGPSVERMEARGKDWVYDIEVTTNRVDAMSVRGIAREAAAILPMFGIKAKMKPLKLISQKFVKNYSDFTIKNDPKLIQRIMGVVVEDIQNWKSPEWMTRRLTTSGIRSLNSVVDITNYVMTEIGHPTHVFDFDKIITGGFNIRESKKGERIVSLDNKEYALSGGDIVIARDSGEIIDLPGIMGTKNSVVSESTKRVLFFLDNNDPVKIRRTSMSLGIRTVAATLNEKGVDPYLGETAILRGIELFSEVCGAKKIRTIIDIFPKKPVMIKVKVEKEFIESRLGIGLSKTAIVKMLNPLGLVTTWRGNVLEVTPPSFRISDIRIPEDVVEEVARIYGYHNLPSRLMAGELPKKPLNMPFKFEYQVKQILQGLGGNEVYTESLVRQNMAGKNALALANPLGEDTGYLRTSLMPSLIKAARGNVGNFDKYHLFEMANVYLVQKNNLPCEKRLLAGIFYGYDWRSAKGIVETFFEELGTKVNVSVLNDGKYEVNKAITFSMKGEKVGQFGVILGTEFIYYVFEADVLRAKCSAVKQYKPISKYPAQIEDITFVLPQKTLINDFIDSVKTVKFVEKVELGTIYQNAYTFRVWYQNPKKTLDNKEVLKIRERILLRVKNKFGGIIKD